MRRRRPLRHPFKRSRPHRVPPALRRANELMQNENYAEAARAFEKIAQGAERRRGARAPIFHLRAGRAYILAENIEKGMPHLTRGLTMLAAKKQWEPLHRFGQRTADELKELGLEKESQVIADLLEKRLPDGEKMETARDKSPAMLPTQCKSCGAPIRSDEVTWIDESTAECLFCGNPVRGEG
ncbi:MAG: hypothetical protein HN736_05715 [Anaerolineae bacterium]|jgi:hypothetical protein|nr:hypothetical protein [Anaerolineae bacterium]MBT4311031.1 hypothetical protein [Anaerolineae bacterium]MBT4842572.1 hypothetical protein [Anaerolineae bacterium]MBT6060987.1 hypothetical protein [Anaerolineae bacterium]MBT6321909.1 hypothetical protein [Anaerolineae bacterium]